MSETTTTADPIQAAIAAAAAQAAALVQNQANAVAVQAPVQAPAQGTAVAPPLQRGKPMTMDDMATGSIQVDSWLGVKEHGFVVGPDKVLVTDELIVTLDLTAIAPHKAVKFGNPATYLKTYDGVTCATGGSWESALARAARIDPNSREYPSCDLPMTLTHDVVAKGKTVAPLGERLGISLSTTNWGAWRTFYDTCTKAGLAGQVVKVKLGYERRTNRNNNVWGIVTFALAE